MRNILRSRAALLLTIVFAVQAGVFYGMSRGEAVPVYRPFIDFPTRLGQWQMQQEGVIEPEIKQVLRADDYITRTYSESPTRWANLFVAFFKSQRAGQAPHSPKNCLPEAGGSGPSRTPYRSPFQDARTPSVSIAMSYRTRIRRGSSSTGINRATVWWRASTRRRFS